MNDIKYYALSILAVLISLTVHEFSHAYTACKLGDRTSESLGRLTLNPLKHIDPIGALCMIVFHFGWAKPVPINLRNFRKPKRDFAITAIAGPISNLILALFSGLFYLIALKSLLGVADTEDFTANLLYNVCVFLGIMHTLNIGLALFNLIPIPPLDGSRLLAVILPPRLYYSLLKKERYIYYGMIAWLLLGDRLVALLRGMAFVQNTPWLSTAIGVLSLSEMLSVAIYHVSELMLSLWRLIPFLNV